MYRTFALHMDRSEKRERELLSPSIFFSFVEALDVKYSDTGQKVVLARTHSRVIVDVETQRCHRTASDIIGHTDDGLTSPYSSSATQACEILRYKLM